MFNQEEAEKTGKIIPEFGVDDSYDKAETAIQEVNGELDEYLKEQQEFFQCNVSTVYYIEYDMKSGLMKLFFF